jgi:hypothetical protein
MQRTDDTTTGDLRPQTLEGVRPSGVNAFLQQPRATARAVSSDPSSLIPSSTTASSTIDLTRWGTASSSTLSADDDPGTTPAMHWGTASRQDCGGDGLHAVTAAVGFFSSSSGQGPGARGCFPRGPRPEALLQSDVPSVRVARGPRLGASSSFSADDDSGTTPAMHWGTASRQDCGGDGLHAVTTAVGFFSSSSGQGPGARGQGRLPPRPEARLQPNVPSVRAARGSRLEASSISSSLSADDDPGTTPAMHWGTASRQDCGGDGLHAVTAAVGFFSSSSGQGPGARGSFPRGPRRAYRPTFLPCARPAARGPRHLLLPLESPPC